MFGDMFFVYVWSKIVMCFVKEKKKVGLFDRSVLVYRFMARVTYRFLSVELIIFYSASTIS